MWYLCDQFCHHKYLLSSLLFYYRIHHILCFSVNFLLLCLFNVLSHIYTVFRSVSFLSSSICKEYSMTKMNKQGFKSLKIRKTKQNKSIPPPFLIISVKLFGNVYSSKSPGTVYDATGSGSHEYEDTLPFLSAEPLKLYRFGLWKMLCAFFSSLQRSVHLDSSLGYGWTFCISGHSYFGPVWSSVSIPSCWKTSPRHRATTSVLLCRDVRGTCFFLQI